MKKKLLFLLPLVLILGFVGYRWLVPTVPAAPVREAARKLDRNHAEHRARFVSQPHYFLKIQLSKKESYSGLVQIDFKVTEPADLTLDFFGGEVQSLQVNGSSADPDYNGFFLKISASDLNEGDNRVIVKFTAPYGTTGTGLYRYVDPKDQNVYLYSDFEPYDANAMFPCFDQPDLKGTYRSEVTAPKDWTVISTTRETSVEPKGEENLWKFPESKRLSTYVYSLHAGPYTSWTSEVSTDNHTLPLRLFARQSVAHQVDPEEWFSTTRQGFHFFENYFDFPYPYKKYDQLIVPDFNSGAMENVGAVTFNESRFLRDGPKERSEKRILAKVILHELAHMWFGNLVTMKWWNDIWLNESFATFIATRALVGGTPYTEAWVDFAVSEKQKAYFEDQLVTTHPIEFEVPDTEVVFANFDGITYGKGASVIKQLVFFLGEEKFQKGLQDYFKIYSYQNTTLDEFMNELVQASRTGLEQWQKDWLRAAQVNTIRVNYECDDQGKVSAAEILQTAPAGFPTLRQHKTLIGVFGKSKKGLKSLIDPIEIIYSGETTEVPGLVGLTCDQLALIYPNLQDQDYVRIDLDDVSRKTALQELENINDEILRIGLWSSLWDMVIDQKILVTEYLDIFLNNSLSESSPEVLRGPLFKIPALVIEFLPKEESWAPQREEWLNKISEHFVKAIKAQKNIDLQKQWFDTYVQFAKREGDLKWLNELLTKKKSDLLFEIDQDRRWNIVKTLNKQAYGDFLVLTEKEKLSDNSDRGEKAHLAAEATRPDLETKKRLFEQVSKGPSAEFNLAKIRSVVSNLFPLGQLETSLKFRDEFFKALGDLSQKPGEFLAGFAALAPNSCSTDSVNELKAFIAQSLKLPPTVLKRLKVQAQEAERCAAIRKKVLEQSAASE